MQSLTKIDELTRNRGYLYEHVPAKCGYSRAYMLPHLRYTSPPLMTCLAEGVQAVRKRRVFKFSETLYKLLCIYKRFFLDCSNSLQCRHKYGIKVTSRRDNFTVVYSGVSSMNQILHFYYFYYLLHLKVLKLAETLGFSTS